MQLFERAFQRDRAPSDSRNDHLFGVRVETGGRDCQQIADLPTYYIACQGDCAACEGRVCCQPDIARALGSVKAQRPCTSVELVVNDPDCIKMKPG